MKLGVDSRRKTSLVRVGVVEQVIPMSSHPDPFRFYLLTPNTYTNCFSFEVCVCNSLTAILLQ